MLNRNDRVPPPISEALLEYRNGDYRVIKPGPYVRCAATNVAIPLDELKYWDVDTQKAFVSPEARLQALGPYIRRR